MDVSKRFGNSTVGRAIKLLTDVKEVIVRHGLRAAEDVVIKAGRDEVLLAKLLVATAWSKLGLSDDERDTLLKVLSVGGSP